MVLIKGGKIVAYLGGGVVLRIVIRFFIGRLRKGLKKAPSETVQQANQRIRTITSLLVNTTDFVISLLVIFLILAELGVDLTPFLTGAGILGLGVGLGMKDLAADMVAGFFLLLENQVNLGDWVKIGSSEGKVVKISLRTLVLRDSEGQEHIIPNSAVKTIIKKIKKKNARS